MSDFQINKVKVLDPRVLQQEPVYKVEQGADNISYQVYAPNTANSSSLSYNFTPPSESVISDRIIKYNGPVTFKSVVDILPVGVLTLEAFKGKQFLSFGLNSTLIDHPLNQVFDNTQVQINTASMSNKSGDNFNILKWLMNDPHDGVQKGTPSRLEMYQNFSGSSIFPNSNMQGIGQANPYEAQPNGAFEGITFCNPDGQPLSGDGTYTVGGVVYAYLNGVPVTCDNTGATTGNGQLVVSYTVFIRVSLVERAFISPFIFNETEDGQTGLYNIRSISINHNLKQPSGIIKVDKNFNFVNSDNAKASIQNITTTFPENNPWKNLMLEMTYRSPSIYEQPPKINTVPYHDYTTATTTRTVNVGAGGKVKIRSDNTIPTSIPNLMLIAIKPTNYEVDENEYFFSPDSIKISYGQQQNIMSSTPKQTLYEMSKKNGVNMSRSMWYGYAVQNSVNYDNAQFTTSKGAGYVPLVGGFLALVPGVDFELKENEAGGLGVNKSFSIEVDFENHLNKNIPSVDIVTVFCNSGFLRNSNGESVLQLNPITEREIIELPIDMDGTLDNLMVGGAWWNKVGSFLKKNVWKPVKALVSDKRVRDFAKEKLRETGNPYARIAADGADKLGFGVRTGGRKGLSSLYD